MTLSNGIIHGIIQWIYPSNRHFLPSRVYTSYGSIDAKFLSNHFGHCLIQAPTHLFARDSYLKCMGFKRFYNFFQCLLFKIVFITYLWFRDATADTLKSNAGSTEHPGKKKLNHHNHHRDHHDDHRDHHHHNHHIDHQTLYQVNSS